MMAFRDLLRALDLHSFVAFDFETTGLDPGQDKITEFAAVRFQDGEVADTYDTLVNPQVPIPSQVSDITGITDEMLADAPTEKEVVGHIFEFLGNDPIVAHNIDFDMAFLRKLKFAYVSDRRVNNPSYDTLALAQGFLFFLPNHQLGTVAEFFGYPRGEEHRALVDTINVGHIFIKLIKEVCSYPLSVFQKILAVLKNHDVPNKDFYVNLANLLLRDNLLDRGLLASEIEINLPSNVFVHKGLKEQVPDSAVMIFGEGGSFEQAAAENEENGTVFEVRQNQIRYSDFVSSVFSKNAIGVAEAGTGLGKSLAYLFPALKMAHESERGPTVVACYTKNLQDQLFYQEVPKLAQALDISFTGIVMKGRQNYLCKTRLDWLVEESDRMLSRQEALSLVPVIAWMRWTKTGDFDECPGFINRNPARVKSLIRSDPGYCARTICRKHKGCFVGPLREKSQSADLIVVNHSLLLSELSNRRILPPLSRVIIDEAHNLVKVAYDHFQVRVSHQVIRDMLNPVDPKSKRSRRLKSRLDGIALNHPAVGTIFSRFQDTVQRSIETSNRFFAALSEAREGTYDRKARYSQKKRYRNFREHFGDISRELGDLLDALQTGIDQVGELETVLDRLPKREIEPETIATIERISQASADILSALTLTAVDQQERWVYWEEGTFVNGDLVLSLNGVPIDIGENLTEIAFEPLESVVATSATLSIAGDFRYFLSRLGLEGFTGKQIYTKTFLSPFAYEDQCRYFQWAGDAHQKSPDFPLILSEVIEHVNEKWKKRTLVLFTSRRSLEQCYDKLVSRGFARKNELFAQFASSSRTSLLRGFKNSTQGVLLGTSSFWEGVDLPKDLLEVLIVTKLPFDVPTDPIIQAYGEQLDAEGRNAFMEFSVPEAAVRLRQGFGRLIRSSYDEGIFINMDNRVVRSKYGPYFQEVIPVTMRTFSTPKEL